MSRFKTPSWWYDTKSLRAHVIAQILRPFAALYGLAGASRWRFAPPPYRSSIPVLCIGNLTAGGSGKTPTALAVMDLIRDKVATKNPVFLTRGYGGTIKAATFVDPEKHTAADVGDEALLLVRAAPTIVSADRRAGARMAEQAGHDLIVMDDGFQNPSLVKTLSLIAIDGKRGFGNGRVIPAGALREPLEAGLTRADAFVVIGGDVAGVRSKLPAGKPIFGASLSVPRGWIADTKSPYVAFCGIGIPEKFKETLEERKIKIAAFVAFPDHHAYTQADLDRLRQLALMHKARFITTEKDALRLPLAFVGHAQFDTIPVALSFENPEAVSTFIEQKAAPC